MKFNISTHGGPVDLDAVEQALLHADPAAVVDLDGTSTLLRVSTCLDGNELQKLVSVAGVPVALADVQQLPSECCGGCSG